MSAGVVLIGLGAIGLGYDLGTDAQRFVQTHARAFASHPSFRLRAGVDPDPAQRRQFTDAHRAPAFATVEEALDGANPELVVIASPTPTHAATLSAVLAHCRPHIVLCEKPLAETPATGRAMLAECAAAGVDLYVNYFRRALPAVLQVRDWLRDGRIAPGAKAVGWYSKGLLHNGSHLVDLLGFWLGALESAQALGPPRDSPVGPDLDCQLRFAHGESILLSGWHEAYAHLTLEMLSRSGRLHLDGDGSMRWQPVVPDPGWPGYHTLSPSGELLETGLERYQWFVADRLARLLEGETEPVLCTGAQALATLETIDALLVAAQGRKA